MTVEPVRGNGRTRRVSAPPLQVIPPEVSPDWDRWRGSVTSTLATLVDDVGDIKQWMLEQRTADAREAGADAARNSGLRWVAPSLYQLIQIVVLLGVAYIAFTGH